VIVRCPRNTGEGRPWTDPNNSNRSGAGWVLRSWSVLWAIQSSHGAQPEILTFGQGTGSFDTYTAILGCQACISKTAARGTDFRTAEACMTLGTEYGFAERVS